MNHRKYQDRCQALISFERNTLNRVKELLPKGVTITEEINELLNTRLTELEIENCILAPVSEKGAIKTSIYNGNGNGHGQSTVIEQRQGEQTTLDKFLSWSDSEMLNLVKNVTDSQIAWKIKRKAHVLEDFAETQAKKLDGTLKQKEKQVRQW